MSEWVADVLPGSEVEVVDRRTPGRVWFRAFFSPLLERILDLACLVSCFRLVSCMTHSKLGTYIPSLLVCIDQVLTINVAVPGLPGGRMRRAVSQGRPQPSAVPIHLPHLLGMNTVAIYATYLPRHIPGQTSPISTVTGPCFFFAPFRT